MNPATELPHKTQHPKQVTDQSPQLHLLLGSVLLFYLGQQTLNPIIAPLARQVGLAEWQVGLTISTAALMVVLTSQHWGQRAQSWGVKPVLVTAMTIGGLCMTLFWFSAHLGSRGLLAGGWLFAAFLLLRGIGFGAAMAMVPPTVQAGVAASTHDEQSRIKGMAGIGAVQATALVGGAVLGGLLSSLGLMVPLAVVPALMLLAAGLLSARLRPQRPEQLVATPASLRLADPRIWPWLVSGLGVYLSMGLVQTTIGFLAQDRMQLAGGEAGMITGLVLAAAGVGMIATQALLVPKLHWAPARLVLVGAAAVAAGCLLLLLPWSTLGLALGMLVQGIGLGLAMPGGTAGPTLAVESEEQGGLAGLVGAANALTFIVAPTLGTTLYAWHALAPVGFAALSAGAVSLFVAARGSFWAASRSS